MRAEIILYDGFDDLDAFAPHEVLRRAAVARDDFSAELVTVDGAERVTSAYGVALRMTQRLGQPDLLLVPGGGWATRAAQGARRDHRHRLHRRHAGQRVGPAARSPCHHAS